MSTSISNINFSQDFPEIHAIHELALDEYAGTIQSVDYSSDRLQLGICLQVLKSVYNHLSSLKFLLEKCYTDSGGAVATSLWEKCVLLQFMLIDKESRVNKYIAHDTVKKLPWKIKEMVKGIVASESIPKGRSKQDIEDLFYLQYTYFCAIKHGNPYTLTYLNRLTSEENFFRPTPVISPVDKDLIGYIFLLSNTTLIETLKGFAKQFCYPAHYKHIKMIDRDIQFRITTIKLEIPQIIRTSPKDFRPEFWDHLIELDKGV